MLTFDKVARINRVGARCAAAVVSLPALAVLLAALLTVVAGAPAFAGQVTRLAVCESGAGCDGADVRMQGATNSDFGFTTVMGYLDGDGLADLVIGAPAEGRVYIFFGSVSNPDPDPNSPLLDVSAADVILSPDPATTGSKFGFSAAVSPRRNAGDTNNPLLIGAPGADALRGAAYVLPASAWLTVGAWNNTPGIAVPVTSVPGVVRIAGVNMGDEVGFSTAFGPVLTLGAEDFVIGARRSPSLSPAPARDQAGVIFVVGETAISPIVLSGTAGVTIRRASGAVVEGGLGEQVVVADFLPGVGGGLHEVAASGVGVNPSESTNPPGRVYVFAIGADIDLAAGGANIRRIVGDSINDFFGFSLVAGDFDNSGTADLAAGAIYGDTGVSDRNAGAVYLFSNADLSAPAAGAVLSSDPNAETEATLSTMRGARKWDVAGFSLATGDVSGDGIDDLAIGSRWHEKSLDINDVDAGLVSILNGSGPLTWPTIIGCTALPCAAGLPTNVDRMIFGNIFESGASDEMGYSVALGDFNRDSAFDDVAVGTVAHERVYLISLNNSDEAPATATGQLTDTLRDIRDGDDDGDGYIDGAEDADDDGVLDAMESDPVVPNRDGGVAFGAATPASVDCDQTFTVTVNVSNASPNLTIAAAELRLRVTLPPEVTYQNGTTVCGGVNQGGGAFPLASFRQVSASAVAPLGVVSCTFDLRVAPDPDLSSVSLTADLDATITAEIPDGHPGIVEAANTSSRMISFTCPDLMAAKAGPVGSVTAGTSGTLDYTINVNNVGGTAACTSPRVVDTLPAGVTCGTATGTGWACVISTGSVTCTAGASLGINAAAAPIALDCTVAANVLPAMITNNATASCVGQSELDVDDSVAPAMTTVITEATLSLTATDNPDPVAALNAVVYTFAVANAGPSDAQALQLTITPPAGQSNATPAGTGWSCAPSGGNFLCTRPVLAPGSAPNVTMTTTVAKLQTTPITAAGSLTWTTTNPPVRLASDSETTTVLTQADLGIVKTDSPNPVNATENLTYTLAVSNANGGTPANNITVIDTLPAGVAYVSAIGTGWTCGAAAGVVTCTLPTLADNTSANDITIVVTPDTNTFGSISNTASVSALGNQDNVAGNNTDTELTTVNSLADLAITKSDSVDPTGPGASLAYTLMVTNNGPSVANTVTVVDDLPGAGATKVAFVSGVGTGWACVDLPTGTVTCTLASLASGASSSVIVTVTIDMDTDGTLTNTAVVSASNNTDTVAGNNSDSETTVVDTAADLSIVKTDSVDPVAAGGSLTYTLTVDNLGPDSAGDVTVTDTLPSGVTFVSATGTNFSCGEAAGVVTCTRNSMPDGPGSQPITIVVTVGAGATGTLSNSATISALNNTDNVAGNNSDTETTAVTTTADLAIAKTDSVDPAAPGGALNYTLSVTNNGPGTVSGVTVVDTLPLETVFGSWTGTNWSCVESPVRTVTCTLGVALAMGPAAALTINTTLDSTASGTQTNTASVTSASNTDGTAGNNSDSENTGVSTATDLELVKTDNLDPRSPSDSLTYTLTVSNLGPEQAGDLTLTDTLPSEVTFVSAVGATWTCGQAAGVVTCTKNKLNASGMSTTTTVVIVVTVNASAAGTLTNTATVVAGNNADSVPANNTNIMEQTTVATAANLSITKTDSIDPATENQNLTWTLTATNNGADSAADVTVTDMLPAGVSFVSATGSGWTCMNSAGTVTCVRGADLASGATASAIALVVTVDVGTAGPLSNTASVDASNNTDGTPGNDSDTEATAVNTNAELAIVKTDSVDPVAAGGMLDYTLSVTNNGPSDAGVVTVVDTLPSGVTYVTGTGTGWTCPTAPAGPMITCTRASLASTVTAPDITVSVTVDSTTAGTLSNTASVSAADNTDTVAGNNSDTETTDVATAADLSITKTDSVDPATENQNLTWTLTATNNGTDAAADVTVTDVLPVGVSFVSATGTGWTCMNAAGTVTCVLGSNLAASTSANAIALVVTVNVGTAGPLSNTASVASPSNIDGTPGNDSDTEATAVNTNAELAIVKTDSADPAPAGGLLDYTLTVTNNGPSVAGIITVVDTLPSGVTFNSAGGTGWACGEVAGVVTCTRASLAGSTTAPDITINVTVDSTTAGTLSNTAVVSAADNTDTVPGNNTDTETTDVATAADLSITMTDSPDPVDEGMNLTWTMTVTNNGTDSAADVTVTDTLPAGVAFVSATGTDWTCMNSSGTVTCVLGSNLAASTSAGAISLVGTVNLGMAGSISNTASVAASNNTDGTPANNSDTELTTATGMLLDEVSQVDMMAHGEVTWSPVAGAAGYNLYRGDLSLLRTTGVYTQDTTRVLAAARFCGVTDMVQDDGYLPQLGQAVFYMVTAANGVTEGGLGTDSLGTPRSNANPCY